MITRYDEMFCHQTVSTFDTPGTSAREWTERAWCQIHEINGAGHLATGFGYYPNRNVMDAFVCYTIEDKIQYTIRASRVLRPDIDVFKVGPFTYEVIEPLKRARYILDENEYGLSFDITLEGTSPFFEETPAQYQVQRGRVKEHIKRIIQSGRASGWLKTEEGTVDLDKDNWAGERDRSWGVRVGGADMFVETGVQDPKIYDGMLFNFVMMHFKDWGACFHIREVWDDKNNCVRTWHFGGGLYYPFGVDKEPLEFVRVDHNYVFNDERPEQQRRFAGGNVKMEVCDGRIIEAAIKPITICYQAPGGYGGFYKNFVHGVWMGEDWMDGYKFDLTDPDVMAEIWGYCDYGSEFTCNGEVGYGTTELLVVGKYPKYGYMDY